MNLPSGLVRATGRYRNRVQRACALGRAQRFDFADERGLAQPCEQAFFAGETHADAASQQAEPRWYAIGQIRGAGQKREVVALRPTGGGQLR